MPIIAKEPISIPSKTYDKYRLKNLTILSPDLNSDADAIAIMVPYSDTDGEDQTKIKVLEFRNIMSSISAGDKKLLQCFMSIMEILQAKINDGE